jgi:hypothetical protein
MVETHEISERIQEQNEEPAVVPFRQEAFRRFAAVYLGVAAMLLAIAVLGGNGAGKEMLDANIHASDTYAFYQAKYMRQTLYQMSAAELELLSAGGLLSSNGGEKAAELIKRYRDTAARYESEPTGDGKKELLAKAMHWEGIRDRAKAQLPNFEYAEALFQIAIVLGSVSIVASSPWLLGLSGVLSLGGTLLTANGYLLLVPIGSA